MASPALILVAGSFCVPKEGVAKPSSYSCWVAENEEETNLLNRLLELADVAFSPEERSLKPSLKSTV